MTGEVTLRGKALEIGGVKEKVLAAYRAGLREVILPKTNEKDLRDVPDEVRANMAFTFAATMDDVFRIALLPAPPSGDTATTTTAPAAAVLADHPPPAEVAASATPLAPPPAPAPATPPTVTSPTPTSVRPTVAPPSLLSAEPTVPAHTLR